jgi:hypothetical protein
MRKLPTLCRRPTGLIPKDVIEMRGQGQLYNCVTDANPCMKSVNVVFLV